MSAPFFMAIGETPDFDVLDSTKAKTALPKGSPMMQMKADVPVELQGLMAEIEAMPQAE
jgi:hypothetical protein